MASFDKELRAQLRDDLIATLRTSFHTDYVDAMRRAVEEALDKVIAAQLFDTVDTFLDHFFSAEEMDCWLSFSDGRPDILVGVGPGDTAASFTPQVTLELYNGRPLHPAQREHLKEQAVAIRKFIGELQEAADLLEARAADALQVIK
jgi:hypothetical protein